MKVPLRCCLLFFCPVGRAEFWFVVRMIGSVLISSLLNMTVFVTPVSVGSSSDEFALAVATRSTRGGLLTGSLRTSALAATALYFNPFRFGVDRRELSGDWTRRPRRLFRPPRPPRRVIAPRPLLLWFDCCVWLLWLERRDGFRRSLRDLDRLRELRDELDELVLRELDDRRREEEREERRLLRCPRLSVELDEERDEEREEPTRIDRDIVEQQETCHSRDRRRLRCDRLEDERELSDEVLV